MSDINDLLEPRSASAGSGTGFDTGGFSTFVIGALNAIVVVLFFLVWAAFSIPLFLALAESEGNSIKLLLQILVLAAGFVVAVCATGFAVLMLDIRRQLIAIRRALSER